eukprot:5566483-Alexandrium_andersonii.AAC.1
MRCGAAAGGAVGYTGGAMKGSAIGCCAAGRRNSRIAVHRPKTSVSRRMACCKPKLLEAAVASTTNGAESSASTVKARMRSDAANGWPARAADAAATASASVPMNFASGPTLHAEQ